jgi:hypothetical protein
LVSIPAARAIEGVSTQSRAATTPHVKRRPGPAFRQPFISPNVVADNMLFPESSRAYAELYQARSGQGGYSVHVVAGPQRYRGEPLHAWARFQMIFAMPRRCFS